ncbi:MAG TPA: DUF2796 domain-containing protein [Cellvibrionaceae bacterium]
MKHILAWVCLLGCVAVAWAQQSEHLPHGAHVHGHAHMNVVLDDGQVFIELISPMANLVGFEHAPLSHEDKKAWAEARAYLQQTQELFVFAGGRCQLKQTELNDPFAEHSHHGHEHSNSHKDLVVTWLYTCDQAMPQALQVNFLPRFSAIEKLDVNWVSEQGQGAQVVTPERVRVDF